VKKIRPSLFLLFYFFSLELCVFATPLIDAVGDGDLRQVNRLLLENQNNPDYVNNSSENGNTALIVAAGMGNVDIVHRLLLVPGIDVNQSNDFDETALVMAALNGHITVVDSLILAGALVNVSEISGTPLHFAALNGHSDIVERLLLVPEIDINQVDGNGTTALVFANVSGHPEIAEMLRNPESVRFKKLQHDEASTRKRLEAGRLLEFNVLGESLRSLLAVERDTCASHSPVQLGLHQLGIINGKCPVCLESFVLDEEIVRLPSCHHGLHHKCFDGMHEAYLSDQRGEYDSLTRGPLKYPRCPYCRKDDLPSDKAISGHVVRLSAPQVVLPTEKPLKDLPRGDQPY
jgi:hypothetical protein